MALEYIQLFADMEELFEPYDDAQRGRLMMAMMAYAYRGEAPEFAGVEKFVWPVLRQHIDRCAASVEAKKAAGSKGGKNAKAESASKQREAGGSREKQSEADESRAKQTEAETSREKQSKADESKAKQNAHIQEQEQDHEHEHDHKQEKENNARATAATAAGREKEPIIGIDGSDLSEAMEDYDRAGGLVSEYRLPDSDQSREAVLMDAGVYGWEKVEAALKEAALGNSRAMLSVNFYRAVLKNAGKAKGGGGRGAPAGDSMLRYTPEERKKTYSAAVLNFDEE